jgi:CBS domain-containing protein
MRLLDFMTPTVVTAQAHETIDEARSLMQLYRSEHLPVFAGQELRGVLRSRDVHAGVTDAPPDASSGTCLDDLLASGQGRRTAAVTPMTSIEEARWLMESLSSGCLLVTNKAGELLGIVTASDLREAADLDHDLRDPATHGSERSDPRTSTDLDAHEFLSDQPGTTAICNLSAGGALLHGFGSAPAVGDVVALEWRLPGDDDELWAAGRVVREVPLGGGDEHTAHAIEFVAIAEGDRARVRRYVANRLAGY